MSLTGLPVLLVLAAAAAGICGATGRVWQRCTGVAAWVVRSVMLLLVMASGAVLAADIANRRYGFYTSFAELTGGTGSATAAAPSLGGSLDAATTARGRGRRLAQAGHGTVVWLQLNGTRSHTRRTGLVYLPADYFTAFGSGPTSPAGRPWATPPGPTALLASPRTTPAPTPPPPASLGTTPAARDTGTPRPGRT